MVSSIHPCFVWCRDSPGMKGFEEQELCPGQRSLLRAVKPILLSQQILVEHLTHARHCAKCCGYSVKSRDPSSSGAYGLIEKSWKHIPHS